MTFQYTVMAAILTSESSTSFIGVLFIAFNIFWNSLLVSEVAPNVLLC
ncbi:Uncharacterised protein [Mycobacteroides abscessus subsp. abscessus]|nr:Uncharacterised protein [Mycobacteroides abscessus subsp. abscessus]